jgi:hypothetical protein
MVANGRRWAIGALFLLFAGACDSETGPDPAGDYRVRGETPRQESLYAGALRIAENGPGYRLTWILDGGEVYSGAALYIDNVLGAVYWPGQTPNPGFAIAIYRVNGGELSGTWLTTATEDSKTGREVLRGSPDLVGQYEIVQGEGPDGGTYSGTVQMVRQGRIHDMRWYLPDLTFVGRGLRLGDLLVVAYARGQAPGIVAYCMTSETGKGVWSYGKARGIGTEVISRSLKKEAFGPSDIISIESDCKTLIGGDLALGPS